ncbi:MFS transporter, partial [Pseudomonas amygdali pv. morsprunorum]|nr:MFS transporter [Pseudomonas amygdali pv. morsprunorum]
MTNNLLPLTLKLMDYSPALLGILIGASGSGNILASIYISKRATRATRIQTGESIKPMLNSGICTAACFLLIGLLMGKRLMNP